jgi:hypothetical protein
MVLRIMVVAPGVEPQARPMSLIALCSGACATAGIANRQSNWNTQMSNATVSDKKVSISIFNSLPRCCEVAVSL